MPTILLATPEDAHRFENVDPDVFDAPIDPARLVAYLAEPNHFMAIALTADEDGNDQQIIGQAAAIIHRHPDKPTELYIDNLGVAPAYRRQGIAMALLEKLFVAGRAHGCEEAWVGTETDNEAAKQLYSRYALPDDFVMYVWQLAEPSDENSP